jgi:hypothetical protein
MKLESLLPFMDKEDMNELVDNIISGELKDVPLQIVYPFVGRKKREELFNYLIEEGNKDHLYGAIPFMSKANIQTLYDKVQNGDIEGFAAEALLPFLGKDKIKELVDAAIKDAMEHVEDTLDKTVGDLFKEDEDE